MIYSKTGEYAISALSYLGPKKNGDMAMIPEISSKTGAPGLVPQGHQWNLIESLRLRGKGHVG